MLRIAHYTLASRTLLAPMAGITDHVFRRLCFEQGAGMCVSEMLASKPDFFTSKKSRQRHITSQYAGIKAVQLVGTDAATLANAARHYASLGAHIIDINMGCPAKKVCNKAAGSALLRDTATVRTICKQVVQAVDIPVTLKIRTGWCPQSRNAVEVGFIAQDTGIASLVIHGRTRADRFLGSAEYDTIAAVKQHLDIPVIANGDITNADKALRVLRHTGADGIMIGRGAQGNPWLFRDINARLSNTAIPSVSMEEVLNTMQHHHSACIASYGHDLGAKLVRKHMAAYFINWFNNGHTLRKMFNHIPDAHRQRDFLMTLHQHSLEFMAAA